MGRQSLSGVRPAQQTSDFTCWACCTRMIYGHYTGTNTYTDDGALAKAVGLGTGTYQNVQSALDHFGMYDGQDDTANLPTFDEIKESISHAQPLVACVTSQRVSYQENPTGGHYVLITGYDDDGKQIEVVDPNNGSRRFIAYDPSVYDAPWGKWYWACTYYTCSPT